MVNIFHDFFEDGPVDFHHFAVGEGQDTGGSRGVVDDAEVSETISEGEGALFLIVDLDLADSFQNDVVGAALIPLLEDIGFSSRRAGLHFFDETVDLAV